jgi:catechol 2,3-dioxygenase
MTMMRPRLHHVTMKTSHLADMIAWYGTVVGAKVQFQNDIGGWLTNDEANHRLAFLAAPGLEDDPDKIRHNGLHHSAFEYASFDDLIASYERLKAEGILPAFCIDHGLTISFYYKDPDGNFVELQTDNFGDWALSSEFMRSSAEFAANPIGTFFDPEKVARAFAAGRPFEELEAAIYAGEFVPDVMPDDIGLPA